ncbi:MAG TPA: LysM peptidoglycan-binding domain-containing protein [Chloroflexota bacterium]|nr:LysM peptidoglycan-binding domain-containing protein [Chloroflexota bacterium]
MAGHLLLMLLAVSVTATTVSTPARRAVDQALESFSIEEAATGESAFVRGVVEVDEPPQFTPPSEEILAQLRPRPSVVTHVVQRGDTVHKLAAQYRITPETIIWANNLYDPDKLPVGHALLILPMSGVLHIVRPGETLESLAEKYQIVPQAIAETNGLALDKQLGVSEQLVIPGGRPLEPPRPALSTRAVERPETPSRPPSGAPARAEPPPVRVEPATPPAPAVLAPLEAKPRPLKPTTYEVGEGDSLVSLAQRFGVSTATIMLANDLSPEDADALQIGQKLVVPPVSGILHEVIEGDTVRDLASRYGVDTPAVIAANALEEPYIVLPGQKLMIPGGKLPDPPPAPTPAPEPVVSYEVTVGDSVISIAERFGVDARTIARYNGLAQADVIAPGQTLAIPGGRERPAAARPSAPARPASVPAPARQTQGPLEAAASLVRPIVRPAAPAVVVRPPPPPQPVVPAVNNWSVVEAASRFLGYAYVWGGHSPRIGFDCTGFTWYVFGQAGKRLPNHDLWGQMQSGPRVGRDNLQAGDLVFFANTYMPGLSHVGIYIGGNRFIHAGSERTGVTVTSLSDGYWAPRYYGATRPW